jgi:hypothetical protein
MPRTKRRQWPLLLAATGALACCTLSGCITYTVVSATASVAGLAVDAAVGTVKIVGKGVGKAADALLDNDEPAPNAARETPTADQLSESTH